MDEILNLIESVSEGFPSYSSINTVSNEFSIIMWLLIELQTCTDEIVEIFDLTPKNRENLLYAFFLVGIFLCSLA